MGRKIVEDNERAERINPAKAGIRTGNPQLARHDKKDVRLPRRQRAPRRGEPGARGGGGRAAR
ncbi:MAG TPA: hypothetical protein VFA22_04010 [Stellaceae bacterium]|nr:hypothetical protein [Stellaceae bacterium]